MADRDPIGKSDSLSDAEYKKQRKRIRATVDRWLLPLGLRMWQKVDIFYDREFFSEASCGHPHSVTAFADVSWWYLNGKVVFSLPRIAQLDDEQLDYVVRHEFAHFLVNQMREYDGSRHAETVKHEEMVVTRLAQAFDWIREAGRRDGLRETKKKNGKKCPAAK